MEKMQDYVLTVLMSTKNHSVAIIFSVTGLSDDVMEIFETIMKEIMDIICLSKK